MTIKEWFRTTVSWVRRDMPHDSPRSMSSEYLGEFRIDGLRIDPWDGMRVEGGALYIKWKNDGKEVQLEPVIRVRDTETRPA